MVFSSSCKMWDCFISSPFLTQGIYRQQMFKKCHILEPSSREIFSSSKVNLCKNHVLSVFTAFTNLQICFLLYLIFLHFFPLQLIFPSVFQGQKLIRDRVGEEERDEVWVLCVKYEADKWKKGFLCCVLVISRGIVIRLLQNCPWQMRNWKHKVFWSILEWSLLF